MDPIFIVWYLVEGVYKLNVEQILVACKYFDVFLEDLLGLSPNHELDFTLELVLEAHPISKKPYKIAPIELTKLKNSCRNYLKKYL